MISRDDIYSQLAQIALSDFADIVEATTPIEGKLRILLSMLFRKFGNVFTAESQCTIAATK
jgi:hypothetical protein